MPHVTALQLRMSPGRTSMRLPTRHCKVQRAYAHPLAGAGPAHEEVQDEGLQVAEPARCPPVIAVHCPGCHPIQGAYASHGTVRMHCWPLSRLTHDGCQNILS